MTEHDRTPSVSGNNQHNTVGGRNPASPWMVETC